MSLRPQDPSAVPEETRRVAQAAFRKGTLCLRIADALGTVYQDSQFAALFPRRGQPAAAWRHHPRPSRPSSWRTGRRRLPMPVRIAAIISWFTLVQPHLGSGWLF